MNLAPKSLHKDFTEEDRIINLASVFVLFFAALVFFGGLDPANETVLHQEALKQTITRIALEYQVDPKLALFMAEQKALSVPTHWETWISFVHTPGSRSGVADCSKSVNVTIQIFRTQTLSILR